MPVHPSEEEAPEGITEKVAKDPSSATESTASDHEHHHNEHDPESGAKASAQDFQSKGPQIPMNMGGTSSASWALSELFYFADVFRHATQSQQGGTQGTCGRAEPVR